MHVVIATDGSKNAAAAIEEVRARRWQTDCKFTVVAVEGGHVSGASSEEISKKASDVLRESLTPHAVSGINLHGSVGRTLTDYCREHHANLLVVGAYGTTGIKKFLVGSVTDYVVNHPPCNLLIVRDRNSAAALHAHRQGRVLVCIGEDKSAGTIIHNLKNRPWAEGTEFHLLHVFQPPVRDYSPDPSFDLKMFQAEEARLRQRLQEQLQTIAAELAQTTGTHVVSTVLEAADIAKQIVYACTEFDIDLVVVGPREHLGIDSVLLGSVSKAVLANSPCSVEIINFDSPVSD